MRRLQLIESDDADTAPQISHGLKVAFATHDRRHVDAHFGSTPIMMIYEVGADGYRFVEAIEFDATSNGDGRHRSDGEDRVGAKAAAIRGCDLLFVLAIGGAAAARVVSHRIYPIKIAAPEAIIDVIERIQAMMRETPPPWLCKIMTRDRSAVFLED
jgi:nitrogen fixation protein NifX